ncbi:MAG TPA: galactokinase family protein [Bacteroidota bacterium]|nr:galactokinase family protein [Bacteroidota bacterium]
MGNDIDKLKVSAPGRVCLFGEHQDYLQLPVIPCAISLRVNVEGRRRKDNIIRISLPDIRSDISFALDQTLPYRLERDYFRSVVNVLRRHGLDNSTGFDCTVKGNIPIKAGTSSSSALVVAWADFLARMSDGESLCPPEKLSQYAYQAEVLEFNEPGGMMDQCSAAYGGVLFLKFFPALSVEQLQPPLETFVLGDSGESKDTRAVLSRVKGKVLAISNHLSLSHHGFSLQTEELAGIEKFKNELTGKDFYLLRGTIRNRDITYEARELLAREKFDGHKFGSLLNEHQQILRDVLCVSTPKINRMIDAGLEAGAYGGKINGSGGGGCMFVYAPENPASVAEAIEKAGGKSYIVHADCGSRAEPTELAG